MSIFDRWRNRKPRQYQEIEKEYEVLKQASLAMKAGDYKAAYEQVLKAMYRDPEGFKLSSSLVVVIRNWFNVDKPAALQALTQRLYASELSLFAEAFKIMALQWYEEDPNAAYEAVKEAREFAGHDRTSLKMRAAEYHGFVPSDGTFPDGVLEEMASKIYLFRVANKTLAMMVPPRRSKKHQKTTMTIREFNNMYGYIK